MSLFGSKLHGQAESTPGYILPPEEPPAEDELEKRRLFFEKIQRINEEFANRPITDSRKFPTAEEMQREDRER
jgi:hypothetical protein